MKATMGIVGFGRFGRLVARYLRDYFDITVYDRRDCGEIAQRLGVTPGSIKEVARRSVVVLCVPISSICQVLEEIAPYLSHGALVVDTCSVKEYPVAVMKSNVPSGVDILGTHPLFGPDSAAQGLEGRKIVLCPVRIRNLRRVEQFLGRLKLSVFVCSPTTHDQGMASTQTIVQFLGRAFLEMGLAQEAMATPGYERLIRILEVVQNDTLELFRDLQNFNRFARGMRHRLIRSLQIIDQRLEEMPHPNFGGHSEG